MRARFVACLEFVLVVLGATCLGYYGYVIANGVNFRRQQTTAFERVLSRAPGGRSAAKSAAPDVPAPVFSVSSRRVLPGERPQNGGAMPGRNDEPLVGLLEIPRLGVFTPVITGDDEKALEVAAGHLADTPRPWEPGNSAIAGHRDGLFRPLKEIRLDDAVTVRTTRGDLKYRVRDIRVVTPDDVSVLEPTAADSLTLITCYPFSYVGHAPKRFIVRAERAQEDLPAATLQAVSYSPAALKAQTPAPKPSSASGVRQRQHAGAGRARGQRVSSGAGRAGKDQRPTAQRDRREKQTASRDRGKGSEASRRAGKKDDPPPKPKTRRWYHFFKR